MTAVVAAPAPDTDTPAPPDIQAAAAAAVGDEPPITGLPHPTAGRFSWEELDPFDDGC